MRTTSQGGLAPPCIVLRLAPETYSDRECAPAPPIRTTRTNTRGELSPAPQTITHSFRARDFPLTPCSSALPSACHGVAFAKPGLQPDLLICVHLRHLRIALLVFRLVSDCRLCPSLKPHSSSLERSDMPSAFSLVLCLCSSLRSPVSGLVHASGRQPNSLSHFSHPPHSSHPAAQAASPGQSVWTQYQMEPCPLQSCLLFMHAFDFFTTRAELPRSRVECSPTGA